jgi:hypothetical protein
MPNNSKAEELLRISVLKSLRQDGGLNEGITIDENKTWMCIFDYGADAFYWLVICSKQRFK